MKAFAESRTTFPDPAHAGPEGLVAIGDALSVEALLEAYSYGIFPWPQGAGPTFWFSPDPRGIIDFENFHVSRSFTKQMARFDWSITVDRDFENVIDRCAGQPRPGQTGTWITKKLRAAYLDFHRAGYAHSVEVRELGGRLIGGIYGVFVAGLFCGESMFYDEPGASKFALVYLIEKLRAGGHTWIDIQMVTPVLASFGGKYISRASFLSRLLESRALNLPF